MVNRLCDNVRMAVLNEAVSWIGTPYRHQSSKRGIGSDCLGLIIGVWQALYDTAPSIPDDYAPDWTIGSSDDPLFDAACKYCRIIDFQHAVAGDLLTFKWSADLPSRHLAILADKTTIIHAYERHGVLQSSFVPFWQRRVSGAFQFPPIKID